MKIAVVFVLVLASALLDARSLKKTEPRTYGNFGPSAPKTFEVRQASQIGEVFPVEDPVALARAYIAARNNLPLASVRVSSSHRSEHNGVTHVYLQQLVNGLEVANGVSNVNVNSAGQIISVGNSFSQAAAAAPGIAQSLNLSPVQAVKSFGNLLGLTYSVSSLSAVYSGDAASVPKYTVSGAAFAVADIPAELKYIQNEDGLLALVWSIQIEMKDNMYNAMVDTTTGAVVSLMDWVSDASYNVFPIGTNDPEDGERVVIENPAHPVASPKGWHEQRDGETFTDTIGNNVFAQNNPDGGTDYVNNYRPDGGEERVFNFPVDLAKEPEDYVDAAVTNLFYWNNAIHDLFYAYGFDEKAGNFQQDNFLRGGVAYDAVIAFAQDGSGTNNANFMTPPDGQHGRMRMYVWDVTSPSRDGDLDGGIVMHEYAHGISTRLTGGPSNVGCLASGEPGGMGEGWGDFFATVTRTTETSTRADEYAMGDYSAADPAGIRKYVYSTDMTVNPSTYGYLGNAGYTGVHAKGEVWAVILYDVYWNIVEKHGFDPDWFNTNGTDVKTSGTFKSFRNGKEAQRAGTKAQLGGNVKMVQLVIDGMKLQPCSPYFVEARDAIIQADEVNYGGENFCELWTGFAKRGLGLNAKAPTNPFAWNGVEDFEVPAECAN